jgi:uncharacterized membrane protein YidH (DUF202 family)
LSPRRSQAGDQPATLALELDDPGLARERTALAWTRSALNMAAVGTLIARAAFVGHLAVLGVAVAVAAATLAALTWRHGQVIYRERHDPGTERHLQTRAFGPLTGATVLTAAIAVIVTIAL